MNEAARFPAGPRPADPPRAVLAYGVERVPFEGIAALRKGPGMGEGPGSVGRPPASLLKNADHQTILAIAAVFRACRDFGLDGPFAEWGVVAAPRFLGRVATAGAMLKFPTTGAKGVSPLIIPTRSLHAVASSVSLAVKAHGPNFGVGGGPGHLAEALTVGLATLGGPGVAGAWVIATGFDPEPVPDALGGVMTGTTGLAVAMALSAAADASPSRWSLRVAPDIGAAREAGPASDANGGEPLAPLIALAEFLDGALASRGARRWRGAQPGGIGLWLEEAPPAGSVPLGAARRAG